VSNVSEMSFLIVCSLQNITHATISVKTSEKIGTGRVRPSTDNFDGGDGDNAANDANDGRKNSSRNPRNRPRGKPRPPRPEPEILQHPILEKIVIPKTSVQERLMRSKMLDEKDLGEPKIESEPPSTPAEEVVENLESVGN
jgi:hypothetical protein